MIDNLIAVLLLLVNVSAVLNVLMLIYIFFGADIRLTPRILLLSGGIFFVLNLILALIPGGDSFTVILVFLYMVTVICIISVSKPLKNSFLAIPASLMYVQWGNMFQVFERLIGLEDKVYNYQGKEDISLFFFLSDVILFVILYVLFRRVAREKLSVRFSRVEGVIVTIICILYPVMVQFFVYLEDSISHPLYRPFWLIGMLLVNFAVVFAVVHRKKSAYYRMQADQFKEQFQTEYDYFKDYRESNKDTIRFRHDINSHMLVLKEMINAGEYERANAYFAKLADVSGKSHMTYITGNEILDMILNAKQEMFKEQGIRITIDGTVTGIDYMDDVDCCILFSNLIDNAVEASMLCKDERFICITAKQTKNILYFEIVNSYNASVKKTKADGKPHGIGLQNVSDIIKKYHGEYSVESTEKTFRVICCLNMK